MQPKSVFYTIITFILTYFLSACPLVAQTPSEKEANFMDEVQHIATSPLELLPGSDCRLSQLEEKVFLEYQGKDLQTPTELRLLLEQKRRKIQFMRTYIDSLYYMQALQAINSPDPDWEKAMESIEKSLLHNRFYVRSIIFKMNYLLNIRQNAESCLRYVNFVLQEMSSNQKVRDMATTVYKEMLDETRRLIDKKLYKDALDLCHLMDTYFQQGFGIRYIPYREKQMVNEAHQGIYHSYYLVAQKALFQKQYSLAQKYALQAHQYYTENEKYMGGINYALEILDAIVVQYALFAESSGPEEKAYYQYQIEDIQNTTGLVVSNTHYYDPEVDLARDLAKLNHKDSVPSPASKEKKEISFLAQEADTSFQHLNKLTHRQAASLYEKAWEQAHYFESKREFEKAYNWYETARLLQQHHPVRSKNGFTAAYSQNVVHTVEQLLNKAVYYLWKSQTIDSEKLQNQAIAIFNRYKAVYSSETGTLAQIQQILGGYQEKKDKLYCERFNRELSEAKNAFYRQASYGNFKMAQIRADSYFTIFSKSSLPEYASCLIDRQEKVQIESILQAWREYNLNQEKSDSLLIHEKDSLAYIRSQLKNAQVFDSLGLNQFLPQPTSLFSVLASTNQWRLLCLWAQDCIDRQDEKQAQFILGYLNSMGYKNQDTDRLEKQLRKNSDRFFLGRKNKRQK